MINLDYSKLNGLVPAVVQDHNTGRVLMLGFMNEEAFRQTFESGKATFFSRSRNKLWVKGETSGNHLLVREIAVDCDEDSVLLRVEVVGPGVCHRGYQSCFYRRLEEGRWVEIEARSYDPANVYGATE